MCTYSTEAIVCPRSSGKGVAGWFPLEAASVYYDHPVHAPDDHTVNLDFLNASLGSNSRVALELSLEAARDLLAALQTIVLRATEHDIDDRRE